MEAPWVGRKVLIRHQFVTTDTELIKLETLDGESHILLERGTFKWHII